ncbi:hypothetical protein [Desulfohalovibrio reitneri]|uniref:hypothetical protein n=1 Tax=Desulfohalovibrio reitneri TaxID=1307759 RepID=UPI0004A73E6B|nr:hypothetical protein [Desulfohalovibrio reitneri]
MSVRQQTREILCLLDRGFVPYHGEVDPAVYERLGCTKRRQAQWFVRGQRFLCLSCARRCALVNPPGFQLVLAQRSAPSRRLAYQEVPQITVDQLLSQGRPLRVDEAAWATALSERQVRYLVEDGTLERVGDDRPLRISSRSVRSYLGQ